MDFNNFNSFDDFIKFCRECNENENKDNEQNKEKDSCDCKFGSKNAEASKCAREANSDIPGGFQDINPQLFTIVTAIIGTIAANNLPFNLQNAIGNWLELLGQSIITFNAQQQYFQGGPGRLYNHVYRNAANPFCSSSSDESQKSISVDQGTNDDLDDTDSKESSSSKNSDSKESSKKKKSSSNVESKEIEELKKCVCDLSNQINELKNEIEKIKHKDM